MSLQYTVRQWSKRISHVVGKYVCRHIWIWIWICSLNAVLNILISMISSWSNDILLMIALDLGYDWPYCCQYWLKVFVFRNARAEWWKTENVCIHEIPMLDVWIAIAIAARALYCFAPWHMNLWIKQSMSFMFIYNSNFPRKIIQNTHNVYCS